MKGAQPAAQSCPCSNPSSLPVPHQAFTHAILSRKDHRITTYHTRIIWRATSLEGGLKQAVGTLTPLLMQLMPLDFAQLCSAVSWLWGVRAPICSHLSSHYFHQHLCLFHFKLREAPTTTTGSHRPRPSRVPNPTAQGQGVHPSTLQTQDSPVPEAI